MADLEVSKKLKDIPFKIQTASLKERRQVLQEIEDVLAVPGITEAVVRFVCRVVASTLQRYRDSSSQSYVKKLLTYLSKNHKEWTLKNLPPVILEISEQLRNTTTSKSTCQSGLYALRWSCVLVEGSLKNHVGDEVDYQTIVLAQANLLAVITAFGDHKKNSKAYSVLNNSWNASGPAIVQQWLLTLLAQPPETGPNVVVMMSALCKHFKKINNEQMCLQYKTKMLEAFTKSLISVKSRPNPNYIKACKELLSVLTKDDVKEHLLPALHKAVLRSPETIIEAVGEVLANLAINLDDIALDIGKSLIGNLHSSEESVRASACAALVRLGARCGAGAARDLLAHIFREYHGAGGKLTAADHKQAVLTGAGELSLIRVPATEYAKLCDEAITHFSKVLDSETHEKTLCHSLDMLALWISHLDGSTPAPVVELFKKNLNLKTTTPAVRTAYMQFINKALQQTRPTEGQVEALKPIFIKSVEKAIQQPLQQPVVNEAICAIYALVLLCGSSLGGVTWSALVHREKHVLLQDRALSGATDDEIVFPPDLHVLELYESISTIFQGMCITVLENYNSVADDKQSPIYRALVTTLLAQSKQVRVAAIENVKKLVSDSTRAYISKNIVFMLNEMLAEGKIFNKEKSSSPDEKGSDVTGKMILDAVTALCSSRDYPIDDSQTLAIDILKCCHHPLAMSVNKHIWVKIVKYLHLEPKKLVGLYANNLKNSYICDFTLDETTSNVVSTLVSVNPEVIVPSLVSSVLDKLREEELLRVTRDEYFTYLTPEGELYDKSIIPGNEESKEMNLKRESKAYSYKEQLEELQLRRELEEKRRREGKIKEVPLSAKQKEAIKMQTAKENAIRQRLTVLNGRVLSAVSLTEAALRSGVDGRTALCMQARVLLPGLLIALRSPLAAPHLAPVYMRLRTALLPQHAVLADSVGRTTLRLYKPQCDLDPSWEEEDLKIATARTIAMVHTISAAIKLNDSEIENLDESFSFNNRTNFFTAPAFCYIFPLLKVGLTSAFAKTDETMVLNGLQVIMHHATLRGSTTGRIQTQCTAALLETATCASGEEGCCKASVEEVQCLLVGLQSPMEVVRDAVLRALLCLELVLPDLFLDSDQALQLTKRFLIAKFDVSDDNKELASQLWERVVPREMTSQIPQLAEAMLQEVQQCAEPVQRAAAAALAYLVSAPQALSAAAAMRCLLRVYRERLPLIPAKLDQFGHVVEEPVDEWSARRGAAFALSALAPHLDTDGVAAAVKFFVAEGLADRAELVRAEMLNAAMTIVELHGKETISSQLPVFEEFLDTTPKSGVYDAVRQCVVLLMGSLARHLGPDDARIRPITLRLIAALSTPSQQVQEAVSNCLPHLIISPALKDEVPGIVNKLMKQLLTAEKYGDRKGAAYGIAGIVKGLGILALKQLDIMTKLTEAIQEKKNYKYREGALFAFEMLCLKLGRLFEPYIVHVLPHLLMCFGDGSQYVRAAADDTAKLIMSKLSAHGVKLVLPSLLAALHDDNWRTKTGSVELLGAMAYCAPKQLSSCLPSIVPKLIEVLSDSHMRVQAAGAEALKVIGSVIRNPEIQAIVPVLLQALQDPSNKTSACLQTLLDTKFVHFIDAPSLALIMPVVQRAFLDRSTETRKMAAQIIGNMYSLTDQKDLMPYLPNIIPGLKTSLLDPVPEVRSVSARALGAMVRGMGESSFEDLLPWLMQTLTSESSSVDRSGAAQGLSEVVAGLGVEKLHKLMPDIIATAERTDIAPHVKDGYIMMFIYMPGAFTNEFTPYIGQIINPILKALADENEYVRETALKAGQRIVNLYAASAITLLLPELERGLFDDNWRIRYSSVQLLGDLLYRISGVSGKMSTETASEDDNFGTEQSHQAIIHALGVERRNRVLAGLYMGRSDVALMVRQAALHVWKVVVTNTPKTLREILPTLFGLLLGCLASTSYDKRQVAARTLGDLVRKLGERVLPEIVPILERGLQSERADQRQGVCIGLGEIIASTSRDTVLTFADGLVPTVRKALCDPLPEVRMAAARTFDSLHATVGSKALDDILPFMLEGLHDPDPAVAEATLDGLRQVMAIKSRAVLPYLVPQLTSAPANTRALSALAAAAGDALVKHLHRILPALLAALEASRDTPNEARELEYCRGALLPVTDEAGVRNIVDALLEAARSTSPPRKRAAAALLCAFVSHTRADLTPYVPQLLRGLILLFAEEEREVLQMAWEALQALTKTMDAERQIQHVGDVRQAVRFAASDLKGELLPGFCLPKGIAPILPLFRESILNGLPEDKENAALMLGEVIKLTSAQAIQPSVVHITGPLIRILGDRFNANVKAAVLETLALLLSKVGVMLKQFLPQLQTTFLKALNDANRPVRLKAGYALSQLVLIHTRADPLFVEMHNGIKNTDDPAIRETMLQALRSIITGGGDKMSEPLALSILTTLTSPALLAHPEDPPRAAVGGCLGALIHCLPTTHLDAALHHHILSSDTNDWTLLHGRSCALFVALKETPQHIYLEQYQEKINKTLLGYLTSDKIPVVSNGIRGIGYLIRYLLQNDKPVPPNILSQFVRSMNHTSNEVKQLTARVCTLLGREVEAPRVPAELLRALVPALVNGTKEKNSYVRANSEIALRAVLHLRDGDNVHQQCAALLEEGAREALADVVARVLRRGLAQPDGKDEELDCTLIT
ncbi:eIF-2-alpha kinase activator GCN1 [Eumeta japonica]|uniref:eIF-2-alpha kinase activator GCN1 n=1 Tax=Eumeta variegata TaxID=151549 RepID=A0A4C1WZE1_EUMVA|nr:eIF-2-alpha kinase activator GCN1 [Eumeta japonica]